MLSRAISISVFVAVTMFAVSTDAATFNFRATKKDTAWNCVTQTKTNTVQEGLTINVLIDEAPEPGKVELSAKYTDAGTAKEAAVPHAKTVWSLEVKDAKVDAGSAVTVAGKIDGVAVTCTAKVEFVEEKNQTTAGLLPAATKFTKIDALADGWLESDTGKKAVNNLLGRIVTEQALANDKVVLLKHLPSGAPAFPYPSSVSEHQFMQMAIVVNMRDFVSVDAAFSNCERPLRERVKGDFGALVADPQTSEKLGPDFVLKPIGSLFQCGPEALAYSLTVTSLGMNERPTPAPSRIEVRPVYHLGATALMGFDGTKKRTFGAKSGVVATTEDRFGPSVYLGATWYPLGVDYGRMRWWNYVVNPFGAVSLDGPKENFVIGNAITITGGISIAIGAAFHKVDELDGIANGAAFTGDGNVPTVKKWSKEGRGLFIGVALDNNMFSALKKIKAPAATPAEKKPAAAPTEKTPAAAPTEKK